MIYGHRVESETSMCAAAPVRRFLCPAPELN